MVKLITVSVLFFVATWIPAQTVDPFSGSTWQGRISYRDAHNRPRADRYELILVKNGTCIVTVTTTVNRKELFQDGDGLWSFDRNIFRLECEFFDAAIEHLPFIDWKSVYELDEHQNSFTVLIKPYPEAKSNINVRFNRIDD
ncbi:MAG: hypothetical protein FWD36_02265 [Treponema sp.]|nr:hypothetical protein [Treponema sp.]